jgi:hypothetical protein
MLHFLPQKNRKQIFLEYGTRFLILLFVFIFIAGIFLIVLFSPSFIFSTYKDQTVKNQLASAGILQQSNDNDPMRIIKNANALLPVLSDEDASGMLTSDLIQKIVSLKNQNVHIQSIAMTDISGASKTFVITGTADTRDDLTAYDNSLSIDGTFSHIDLPVSDLIADADNQFTITLMYTYTPSK